MSLNIEFVYDSSIWYKYDTLLAIVIVLFLISHFSKDCMFLKNKYFYKNNLQLGVYRMSQDGRAVSRNRCSPFKDDRLEACNICTFENYAL